MLRHASFNTTVSILIEKVPSKLLRVRIFRQYYAKKIERQNFLKKNYNDLMLAFLELEL